jgi:hypothetical protein
LHKAPSCRWGAESHAGYRQSPSAVRSV